MVGLPLQHYETQKAGFKRYFVSNGGVSSGIIRFELNGKPFAIQIMDAHVYPQAYAAAMTIYDQLVGSRVVNVVDVGGFTVDCLQLNRMKPVTTRYRLLYDMQNGNGYGSNHPQDT